MEEHKTDIVETGGPLSRTTSVSLSGIVESRNNLGGYVIVQAQTQAEAAKLFIGHPSFAIFPGEAVEIMEVLPIPGN